MTTLILGSLSLPSVASADASAPLSAYASYDEVMQTVSEKIARNDFGKALALLDELESRYPENTEILSRRAALYYWSKSYRASVAEYEKLYALTRDPAYLAESQKVAQAEREAQSGERQNFVSVQQESYFYEEQQPTERDTTLQAGVKMGELIWIVSGALIDRYGLIDRQAGIELYSNLGRQEERRWGYLAYYQTPDAKFLPSWDVSAGFYQGIFEDTEISFVYRHMHFANSEVDILKPGISFTLPWVSLRLAEELYWVPDNHSYASVTTLTYEPSYRIKGYYTFTIGNSAEQFRDENDIRRIRTLSHAVGGIWRFDPSWAVGVELTDGFRSGLYRRSGGKIYLKYFW